MSDGGSTQSEAFARQEAARIQAERDRVIRLRYEQLKVQERNRRTFERDHVTRAEFKERKKEEALHRRYQRLLSTKNSSDPDAETKPATPDAKDN